VTDSENGEAADFGKISAYIQQANAHPDVNGLFPVPTNPFQREVSAAANLSLTVLMIPGSGNEGAIESLFWPVLARLNGAVAKCVSAFMDCVPIQEGQGANQWRRSKVDKARVASTIAVINKRNPGLPLWQVWRQAKGLIPLDAAQNEFDAVSQHLSAI
jgi:hypothetical protein